ncbi:PKD domain-containing protein [Candidatus Gracilibacteria bacterium]|nr:PKD domain-containing protein [Candidatus Gracilibacteria bacterium]
MDTPENKDIGSNEIKENTSSLLDQIIKTSHETTIKVDTEIGPTGDISVNSTTIPPTKKPRDPMTAGMVLKLIGSLLFIAIIFFGSFLAYIVFNPDQASFFVTIFGISPNDIQKLLKTLINSSFGMTVLVFSMVWITSLFKAIWTPKEQKRRRLISWLTAGVVGIFLFSILAFWAYLFKIIKDTPYDNLGGAVIIYDNDIYPYSDYKDYSKIEITNSLIGPITLKYNLATNSKAVMKKNLISINSYEIDFDGAKCANGKSIVNGSDPALDEGIICTFDEVRSYQIKGTYIGKDRLDKTHKIDIPIDPVEIKGIIDITKNRNADGKKIVTLNASSVKNLGNPRWISSDSGNEETTTSTTQQIGKNPNLICFKLFNISCDRYFIIVDDDTIHDIEGSIQFEQDSANLLGMTMTLSGLNISSNEIVDIDWIQDEGTRLCRGPGITCKYLFASFGEKNIKATITLANKKTYKIQGTVILNTPLSITRHAQIKDTDNNILNTLETFDAGLNAYVIKDLSVPMNLIFDARDIIIENPGYKMINVTWKITDSKNTEEKIGEKINFEIQRTERYKIEAIYTFEKDVAAIDSKIRTAKDIIILDLERKELDPVLKIVQQSSDYVPSKITVDASSSSSKNWKIQKFTFDFDDGRPPATGDAVQTYEYTTPGEKKITLTITDSNNEQATISKYIILKDTPRSVAFSTSMSPGIINNPVDFVADKATGQIEEWIWNFGDNTPIIKGYDVSHIFTKAGKYNVSLTIRYSDGTEKSNSQEFTVETTLEP